MYVYFNKICKAGEEVNVGFVIEIPFASYQHLCG